MTTAKAISQIIELQHAIYKGWVDDIIYHEETHNPGDDYDTALDMAIDALKEQLNS